MTIVKDWLQQMIGRMFQPISPSHAIQIASQATNQAENASEFECSAMQPHRCGIYLTTSEPCWYIVAPWDDSITALRSSRIVLVGKLTGMVHYIGLAEDEG